MLIKKIRKAIIHTLLSVNWMLEIKNKLTQHCVLLRQTVTVSHDDHVHAPQCFPVLWEGHLVAVDHVAVMMIVSGKVQAKIVQ